MSFSNLFDINKSNFELQNYSLVIKNKAHKLTIDSQFEILGDFKLPNKTIYIKYLFPNQISDNNFLTLDYNKKCTTLEKKSLNCYVFVNSTDINQTSDNYFNKEIITPINVPIEIKFNISTKTLIGQENFQNNESKTSQTFYSFFNNVSITNILKNFFFSNTYVVKNIKNQPTLKTLKIRKEIILNKYEAPKYEDDEIKLNFFDYSEIKNKKIINWFQLESENFFSTEVINKNIFFKNERQQQTLELEKKDVFKNTNKKKHLFLSKDSFLLNPKTNLWEKDFLNENGFFLHEESHGFLNLDFLINIYGNINKVKTSNFFHFQEDYLAPENHKAFIFKKPKKNTWIKYQKHETIPF